MQSIFHFRQQAKDIISGHSKKKAVICGPCSIHDIDAAMTYAKELKKISLEYEEHLFIVMRVFLEKPRTKNDWRGFINDPDLDGSLNIEKGIIDSCTLLKALNTLDLPLATEFIDPALSTFTQDFITWGFIGARTARSPTHRQLASFLKMPVGFKNPLDGDLETLYSAIDVASSPHRALMPTKDHLSIQTTSGNNFSHGVFRGHKLGPNFKEAAKFLKPCLIDCAHGNSNKTLSGMKHCFYEAIDLSITHPLIKGVMLESFLKNGCQKPGNQIEYGISITDPCLSVNETKDMLDDYYKLLSQSHGSSSNLMESCLSSGSSSEI
jgi:3-deoxy-7-phosphoheptulonate synthase